MHWVRNSVIILVLLFAGGAAWYGMQDPASQLPVNTRLGGDFTLTDQNGERFHSNSLDGKVVLLFFGFTSCPDICPATLARVTQARRMLAEEGYADDVQVVFITFDPARDTPEHLNKYLSFFGDAVIGLTGTEEEIAKVAEQFGVVYLKTPSASGDGSDGADAGYDFSHSDFVYLLDTQGRVRKLFQNDEDIDLMVKDARTLL
jgi:protein SCO1/2